MDWKTVDPQKQPKRFSALVLCGVLMGAVMVKPLFQLIYYLLGIRWPG